MDKDKEEVLENIMEELEQEAKDKEKAAEETPVEEAAAKEPSEASEEAEGTEEDKKKGLFGKKEKKNPLQEKVDELNDKVLRQMAEFENFRKRTDKEKAQQFELGQSNVLEKLLPIVDNFERGLAAVPEAEKDGAFADGMNKIYKQLMTELENLGVTPIEAVGKEFDPNFHNAVMQVESSEYESGIVAQELQKGYMFHDTVLRHSMVGVTP
ncbi:nucleotide exchange factor GrpE [Butyrivibrio sp. CB08]|uniref:nucleotide exchange factor GrpE n=1 Tax=Butyrivibrio sp. CB08 TaxID=2364879 RepID=UPI000EAA9A0C|nr:nucleotide exchange factor GrpE [Butyrivibrio sp. CB08]RKM60014.1 nucleotide exchange factor GrpE [Butyrivibrio sp. CB08]